MSRKLLMISILVIGLCLKSIAQGDLLLTPTRVVFEGNKQKETLNLVNTGNDTATYSISFIQYNMKEDGSIEIIEKPDSGQMFAEPYLRIFPRKVTLAPGEPQVVMLQCRRDADMHSGEYRSHLYFRAEKNSTPLGPKNNKKDSANLRVELTPVFGLSIPVIIRSGTVNVSSALSDQRLETHLPDKQYLRITINRTGNISTYGDIIIRYIPQQGKPFEIGIVRGVGVYTNINRRSVAVKLNNRDGKILENGKLKIQYVSSGDLKRVVFAETEMVIN